MALRTDYKDDILDTSVNKKRVYNLIDQSGNAVMSGLSLEDVTVYSQVGDEFSSSAVNEAFNNINNRNLKTYTSVIQIGLTIPTTIPAIFKALSVNSMIVIAGDSSVVTDLPVRAIVGILTITKKAGQRCEIRFVISDSNSVSPADVYIGQLAGNDGTGLTWTKVSTYIELTGTLTAGETTIKLTDDAIKTDSKFDFYTSIYGVSPTNVTVANGSITLKFDSQKTDMNVEVRVM